ncbi:DUF5134 domain-containing protein [Streptomyces rectiverticillatus]|uniref:DUF5134 domain-containing protein n=1 Tax=Streptomyces rectiverticillatus TaxID=173860 RepID=UPI0015C3460C|nr:DUF5134 domain-containing protein [Streptomyces rectiverticillatus]QLE75023.1 DUF5134 domain-containing protein [Streptomyces rectiverticillatus]
MHGPPLIGWLLVAVCAATGAYCLVRLRTGAGGERRAVGSDALMGLGMAAMAVPPAVVDTRPWGALLFAVVFGAAGVHALVGVARGRADSHHLHHAVGAFAMVYMALAMAGTPMGGRAEHTGAAAATHAATAHVPAGTPLLTGLLLVYFAVYVVRTVAVLVPVTVAAGQVSWPGRPDLTHACRLSMGIGMLAMLLTL